MLLSLTMSPTSTDLLASENLVNCWLREGFPYCESGTNGVELILNENRRLHAPYSWKSALRDVRLSGPVQFERRSLTARELIQAMVSSLSEQAPMTNGRPPDWLENFESSFSHLDAILNAPADTKKETSDFIASEQSLRLGHRFHPSPKSRIGFSDADLRRFSPEWGARFPLRYLLIPHEDLIVRGENSFLEVWQDRIRAALNVDDDGIIFPMHPWQARHVKESLKISENGWRDLGEVGPNVAATASVRTLYWDEADLFLKTSLDVRITNCFRRNQKSELEAIAAIDPLLKEWTHSTDRFRILHEPLSLDLKNHEELRLGVIFRLGLKPELERGWTPLLAASLFGDRDFSLERSRALLNSQNPQTWFQEYVEGLVPPVMAAFWEQGVMFEPHLQNMLVAIEQGRPRRFLLRDVDNMKLIRGHKRVQALSPLHVSDAADVFFDLELGWKRLIYCLIVNHLAETITTLSLLTSETAAETERALWSTLRQTLKNSEIPSERLGQLLGDGALWSKKNLFTRITRTDDLKAPFARLNNPLGQLL